MAGWPHRLQLTALALCAPALSLRAQESSMPKLLESWCGDCHQSPEPEGDFDLYALFDTKADTSPEQLAQWRLAVQRVRGRTMPPPDESDIPTDEQRHALIHALAESAPDVPGARVATLRRLTRLQYEHTVHAVFGVRWQNRDLLPDDASAHGFAGIGDVQHATPLLIEKYLDAAADVANAVLDDDDARRACFGADDTLESLPDLLRRTYRRPIDPEEVSALRRDFEALRAGGTSVRDALHTVLRSILAAPSFLFRVETGDTEHPKRLTSHELATRLAYMLTSAPPDAELRADADDGSLLDHEVLRTHATRLSRHRDGHALASDFATQWLSLRDVLTHNADFRRFPQIWNGKLRPTMAREAEHVFAYIVRENRSVLELLDADYTFVNATLAKHYGLDAVKGRKMRRVDLPDRRRGGILGMSAMLMPSSYPLRTSPVLRGQWILTKLLDAPPPPPPENAGNLPRDDKNKLGLTLRQQLELHRADSSCASCHTQMDALGFALENYGPLGRWRDEVHEKPIDSAAELPDGTQLDGPIALKDALLARRDDFVRAFAKNLLVHGVGRDMLLADEAELAAIVAATKAGEYRFSALLHAVVTSPLFTMRDPDQHED